MDYINLNHLSYKFPTKMKICIKERKNDFFQNINYINFDYSDR